MLTDQELNERLDAHFQANYYTEDYEIQWSVKNWRDSLEKAERERFDRIIVQRLMEDPSVLNITVCTRLQIPEAVAVLSHLLEQEVGTSQRSRTIIYALQNYQTDLAYQAVERFMDSDQDREVLPILARMNFQRAKSHVLRAIFRRGWEKECLHIFYQQKKSRGMKNLIENLTEWASPNTFRFRRRVRKILKSSPADYNPFSSQEVEEILAAIPRFT